MLDATECAIASQAWSAGGVGGAEGRRLRHAIPRIISAAETDLTQMKRVTRKGYGNKTRKTDGKKKQSTDCNKPARTQHC